MPEAYSTPCSTPCQHPYSTPISKMMRYIEKSSIVITVYSGIFRYIQGHSEIFIHVQAY